MESFISTKLKILKEQGRPNSATYISMIFTDFIELAGDRVFGEDSSILGGVAMLNNLPVTVIGQLRGRNMEEQIQANYSMTLPEGFRKSMRLMKQAEKFNRPIVCFVDTIGAYPGRQAEERGQASAIANNIMEMMHLRVPIITILIGYGGSGGALALCVSDRIFILENAVLSVISPSACAEILWKDSKKQIEAAKLLKMSALDLVKQNIVDYIIPEPSGGAHTNIQEMAFRIKSHIYNEIQSLNKTVPCILVKKRKEKFRGIGRNFT